MRVTSVELLENLGQTIDLARSEPVIVTKLDREHVVIISAEHYAYLQQIGRRARMTGSLSPEERALALAADVPSEADQKRYLAELGAAVAVGSQL